MNSFCFAQQVAPYEIFRIEKHEGSTVTPTPYETNVEELTHEMIEHRSLPSSDKKGKVRATFLFIYSRVLSLCIQVYYVMFMLVHY